MACKKMYWILLLLTASCQESQEEKEQPINGDIHQMATKLDSIQVMLHRLEKEMHQKESMSAVTSNNAVTPLLDTPKPSPKKPLDIPPKKPIEPKKEKPTASQKPQNDTIYHYYTNGKISVKIHPWIDSERRIQFFDLYGHQTFETKDIWQSYSVTNRLFFHENGAVSKIEESTNPGASMYMYEATMTFSTTNDPLVKTTRKHPSTLDEILNERPWFWNKKAKAWVQQEVVKETNTPPGEE